MTPRAIGAGAEPAAWPIQRAMADVIKTAPVFDFITGPRVYNMRAPRDAQLPYYVIGTPSDEDFGTFMRRGHRTTTDVHAWHHDTLTQEGVLEMYRALCLAFDRTAIALDGHRFIRGRMRIVAIFADDDAQSTHGVFRYEVDSQWEADG